MVEIISIEPLQRKVDQSMLIKAFGSLNGAVESISQLRRVIVDPSGYLIMHGSFVNGRCQNPTSPFYGKTSDDGRLSDLDFALTDYLLFRELPSREICILPSTPISVQGKLSHSLTYPNGNIKDFLKKKKGGAYYQLYLWLKQTGELTGRKIDLRIYQDFGTWINQQKPYWILADSSGIRIQ